MKEKETKVVEKENVIYLEREFVRVNGKEYANYFVRGKFSLRGKLVEKQVRMDVPKNDTGMYDVLDMVFGEREKVELIKVKNTMVNSTTGKKTITYRYEVENEEGDLRARVVPSLESNNSLLNKLYNDLEKEATEETEEETTD